MPPSRAAWRIVFSLAFLAPALLRAEEAGETIDVLGERPQGSPRAPAAQTTVVDLPAYAGEVRSVGEVLLAAPGVTVQRSTFI